VGVVCSEIVTSRCNQLWAAWVAVMAVSPTTTSNCRLVTYGDTIISESFVTHVGYEDDLNICHCEERLERVQLNRRRNQMKIWTKETRKGEANWRHHWQGSGRVDDRDVTHQRGPPLASYLNASYEMYETCSCKLLQVLTGGLLIRKILPQLLAEDSSGCHCPAQ
jgi:hypothetical protein